MPETCRTRTRLENDRYPVLWIAWERDANAWRGTAAFWKSGNEKERREFSVELYEGDPIGSIHIRIESFGYGCYDMASFEGVQVAQRDLQWATIYAAVALKDHPERDKGEVPTSNTKTRHYNLKAIEEASKAVCKPIGCRAYAERIEDSDGEVTCRLTVRDLNPTDHKQRQLIADHLNAAGFPDVEVVTEW